MRKILLVDDHVLVREAIAAQLRAADSEDVVAEVSDASAALDQIKQAPPDIVIMDVSMPGMSCFEAARMIRERFKDTRIIFISGFPSDEYIQQALAANVHGFVFKSEGFAELKAAIQDVAAGGTHFSPSIMSRLVLDDRGLHLGDAPPKTKGESLSARERELLRMLAQGMSLRAIARQLHISYKTADNHKTRLMHKLNIHDRVELARYAIREGIIQP